MATGFLQAALHHFREVSLPDADLLGRFVQQRDEAAFAELVRRHGSLVLGVCRRILADAHAAEDAFQATFLLLARRSPRLTLPGSLAGWLYAAAVRVAREARRAEQRRCRRESACALPIATSADDMTWRELRQWLDTELARLPDHLRTPLVLCYLEGLSRSEAAQRLGCSETVLRGRLERGRFALRRRLARLGLPLAAPLLLLPAPGQVSAALCATTLATVRAGLAGLPVPATVAGLTAAVSGKPGPAFWKVTVALVLVAVAAGLGGIMASRPVADPPSAVTPAAPAADGAADAPQARTDLAGDPLPSDALLRLGTLRHRYLYSCFLGCNQQLPDGKNALTSTPNEVRWVDMTTGRLTDSWPLPRGYSVCGFSPDGRLALLRDDKVLRLWDLTARKELREFRGRDELGGQVLATFAPDGRVVATNSGVNYNSGLVRLWDVDTGRELWQDGVLGFPDPDRGLIVLGFLADDETLVVIERPEYRVSLRDRATGRERRSFATMPRNDARMTRLTPDGKTVLMGTAGTAVRGWDVGTGKELPPLDGHKDQAHRFAVSRDSKTVLTGGADPFVLVWDWPAGKRRGRIELEAGRSVSQLAVSADGKRAEIICWGERALRFFDLESGKELPPPEGHRGEVQGLAITPDGRVVSAGTDNTVRVWDLRTGQPLHEPRTEHPVGASTLAVSADGQLVATADFNRGTVALQDRDTGRLVRTIDSSGQSVSRVAFAPEGRLLALTGSNAALGVGAGGRRFFLALWDADSGRELRRLEATSSFGAPVFSPDGRLLAEFEGEQVRLLEVSTGRERAALPQKDVHGLAFSPDGQTLACGDMEGITLWELATRRERAQIDAPPRLTTIMRISPYARWLAWGGGADGDMVMRFSPDGHWLAWGGKANGDNESEAVHLWDVWRGEKVRPLTGHDQPVSGLAFAPDGRTLASCSWDTTLLIWDLVGVAARQPPLASRPAAAIAAAWNDLAGVDAKAAYQAVRLLAGEPAQSVPLVRERLRPIPAADKKQVERWLAGLDSDQFAEREEATRQLGRQGDRVEAALRRLLAGNPSAEARRRTDALLVEIEGPVTDAERLRQIRAVEVLEWVGKGEARQLLQALAGGDPEAGLTRDAAAALRRLGRRP
jgi:RNA polymerase sigma factor (sigma-70 family)